MVDEVLFVGSYISLTNTVNNFAEHRLLASLVGNASRLEPYKWLSAQRSSAHDESRATQTPTQKLMCHRRK
jgi:hypothetical protein